MPLLKKWKSMDLFNFSIRENPIMENVNNVFSQISQSHAGSLLRNRRLGSLSSVKTEDGGSSQKKDDASEATSPPLLQRTAIIQKDEKGYGLTVSGDNPVYVASVKPGGAAAKAGVQKDDKIIKVNGKLVVNSNHTEVVKMIRSGSYVALTLLGKPSSSQSSNRDSFIDRNSSPASFRESFTDKITGPQKVDAEKERDLQKQKATTIRVMHDAAIEEYEKLKKAYKTNPSDKLQAQIQEKEKTLKILDAELQNIQSSSNRDSQIPSVNVDAESLNTDTSSVSSWTASVPATVSDLGSDSPRTSPSTSPTPTPYQNLDGDQVTIDSGIEEGSQCSIGMTSRANMPIIGIDDDDFASEDESTGDSKVFADLSLLEQRPAHMAVFLHYVLNHHNPAPVLLYYLTGLYQNSSNVKDLKKWAYEIYSTFIINDAPLKVNCIEEHIVKEIDSTLQTRSDKEEVLKSLFLQARSSSKQDVNRLLEDLRQKKEQGLIEGSNDLKDHMDKNEEARIVEKYLMPDLEKCVQHSEVDDKQSAMSWAISTFLRHATHKSSSHFSLLEKVPSFFSKEKRVPKLTSKQKKSQRGHQFVLSHLYKQENCLHCNKILWGIGLQGYQCSTCEQCVHKNCMEDLTEACSKKRNKRSSSLNVFKPKPPATPIISDGDRDQVSSPTMPPPTVFTQPLKDAEDKERTAFRDAGHSVNSLVNRFESTTPEQETPGRHYYNRRIQPDFSPRHQRKNAFTIRQSRRPSSVKSMSLPAHAVPPRKAADLGRSESMKGRGDQRDTRPARRSKSDVDMDDNTLRAITTSGSSSTSSLRSADSPSTSMDTLTSQINDDSDFDVEPELPSLKQVLGEETVRRLKPKEKKRQDVINELFYTEKCHVRSLKIMDKLFYKPMLKEPSIAQDFTRSLFPNLETMIHLHGSLNNAMKARRKEKSVISTVGDILLQRFDGEAGENFRNGCAIFCRNQSHALEALKVRVRKEPKMSQLLQDAENNPLCHRLALKDIIPKQFMRLTKYPLLIENLLKYTPTNMEEYTNLERALQCSKHILEYVNQAVKDCENHQRLIDLQRRMDKKLDNSVEVEDLKTFELSKHKLLHDGALTWRINNKKQIELHVVLLERAMVLLQKQEERLVLKLQSTQLVAGREDTKRHSPLLWLNNVLARNDATDKRAFFVVNTSKAGPQIYQLVAGSADEQKRWTKFITQASEAMKKNEINSKKKPTPAQISVEPVPGQGTVGENHVDPTDIDEDGALVPPEDVTYNDPTISTSVQVVSPIEKLRQNDENLAAVLEERQGVMAEILNVPTPAVIEKTQEAMVNDDSDPTELITACQNQAIQLVDMMKDSSIGALQPSESGEQIESIEDMSLPIPMEKLRDMANRMNMILTNLLAAVNKRDEERDRLRRELKFAQDELNRLRGIQKRQMEANRLEAEEKLHSQGRPASLVSETSTVSESEAEELKEDSDQTSGKETDNNEDTISMPGLPIEPEPEIVSEIETTLNEVSPVTVETIPDQDAEEITELKEAEVEEVEEFLHEIEPPEDDEIEDSDTPIIELVDQSDRGSSDDEQSDDDDDEADSDSKEGGESTTEDGPVVDGGDKEGTSAEFVTCLDGEEKDNNGDESDSNEGKRDSAEVFHDAVETSDNKENDSEDPGGLRDGDVDNACSSNTDTDTVAGGNDQTDAPVEPESNTAEANIDTKTETDSDSCSQTDSTVTSMGDSNSEQV